MKTCSPPPCANGEELVFTLLRLSVARRFNLEIFKHIVASFQTHLSVDRWETLTALSMIEASSDDGWHSFHSVIREGLQAYLGKEKAEQTHKSLFEYFSSRASEDNEKKLIADHARAAIEAFYHKCALDARLALEWWAERRDLFHNVALHRYVEELDKAICSLAEELHGAESEKFALACLYYGNNLHAQGRYAEAEPLYIRALAIREKALGPDHPDVAASLNNLAVLYRAQGRYAEAEPLYQRALAIREKVLGPDHPDVAASLNNLAGLYRAQGRYAEAEPLYIRALAILEKALGPDHPDVATSLNNLAGLYYAQGRYAEAEPLYIRALAIFEKSLGLDHAYTCSVRDKIAQLYPK